MPDPDITWTAEGIVTDGVWTDVTRRWMTDTELSIDFGRQSEGRAAALSDIEASKLSAKWRNHDNALTPRNSASPYPGWAPGMRLRVTETVGGVDFDLHTGYLEDPEVRPALPGKFETVQVNATDLLGRLASAPTLRGTLAEHIRAEGGASLAEWFPLDDDGAPYLSALTNVALPVRYTRDSTVEGIGDAADLARAAAVAGPPGDDRSYLQFEPITSGGARAFDAYLRHTALAIPIAIGDVVACSVWYRADTYSSTPANNGYLVQWDAMGSAALTLTIADSPTDGIGTVSFIGGGFEELWSAPREVGAWRLITVRLDTGTGLLEVWIGAQVALSTTIAPPADGPWTMTGFWAGINAFGAVGHAQLYIGDANAFTWADHVAQHRHGYTGLERQTVAQRVASLAGYAGVSADLLNVSAAAATPMQVARLSGVAPGEAMQAAARTGQDTLRVNGSGQLEIIPRAERYNQAAQMTIPWGWLAADHVRYRTDKAINDVSVSRTGGGEVRVQDHADQQTRGVAALPAIELDTAIDADPGNLAAWLARTHGQNRTRLTGLRINMLSRTVAERQALLSLRPGHRIQLSGVPAGQPEDIVDLIVHGGKHIIGPGQRRWLELRCGPLLGPSIGTAPTCPVVGDLCGTDAVVAY